MTTRKLDAVLPLRLRDHARFEILSRSLRRNFRDLNRCWVVTTDGEHADLAPLIADDVYRVIPESELIPEIGFYRRLYWLCCRSSLVVKRLHGRCDVTGWYIQQLVKLAVAERVATDFYLTLDADVICMKPVTHDDLIHEGRAITNIRREDVHPEWYASAERILGATRSGLTHGVTPAVLSRDAMIRLHQQLGTRVNSAARALAAILPRASHLRSLIRGWRSLLLRNTPWTEYTLYHTFLESAGIADQYHVRRGDDAIYDNRNSVWVGRAFGDAGIEAFMRGAAFFLVVQSNTDIPPDAIREKVAAYIE